MPVAIKAGRDRMTIRLIPFILFASIWPVSGFAADEPGSSIFSFGGFGTFGVVHSDESRADFTGTATQAVGAGYTHSVSAAVDSRFGGQLSATFSPQLSAVLQVISEQNYDDSYRPHVEWANIKYQFTPEFSLRVGRTAVSTYLVSDYRRIGYANPWVRPPLEVYTLVPITGNDGIDMTYRLAIGGLTHTFQALTGRANTKFPIPNDGGSETVTARDQLVLVDSLHYGSATVRLSYSHGHVTIPQLRPLFDAFRQFGPPGEAIADRYDDRGRLIRFLGVSASYEPGDWFAMGEWGRVITHSIYNDRTGWYISGGHRFRQVTPYLNYGELKANKNISDPGLSLSGLPPAVAMAAGELNGALNAGLAAHGPQTTISLGARWDFFRNVALKVQYDHVRLANHSQGTLTNLQPGFQLGSSVDVVSATMDFVF